MKTTGTNVANIQVRERLLSSLLELLSEKPISAISVAELTKYAQVSRMSFYRNYDSIEQILTDQVEKIVDEYRLEDTTIMQGKRLFEKAYILHFLEFMKRNSSFIDCLISCGMGELVLNAITKYELKKWDCNPKDISQIYNIQLFSGGLYNLYVYLTKNGYEKGLDVIAQMIEESLSGSRLYVNN